MRFHTGLLQCPLPGIIFCLLLTSGTSHAEAPATTCYDADDDVVLSTQASVAFGDPINTRMPQFGGLQGMPPTLKWIALPPQTEVQVEKVGDFQGHDIYRIIYRSRDQSSNSSVPKIICVWFGYQASTASAAPLRPFFVRSDDIRWFESSFVSYPKAPFELDITITGKGNGVYTSMYGFFFSKKAAHIKFWEETGRHVPSKTYIYGTSGKVIATHVYKDE